MKCLQSFSIIPVSFLFVLAAGEEHELILAELVVVASVVASVVA